MSTRTIKIPGGEMPYWKTMFTYARITLSVTVELDP
jgi:hypothetical protein